MIPEQAAAEGRVAELEAENARLLDWITRVAEQVDAEVMNDRERLRTRHEAALSLLSDLHAELVGHSCQMGDEPYDMQEKIEKFFKEALNAKSRL